MEDNGYIYNFFIIQASCFTENLVCIKINLVAINLVYN